MRVFLTGGTGAIGGYAVRALLDAGHTVTALARTPAKAAVLSRQGAEPVTVSLFDAAALATRFTGQDAVINLATAMPPTARFMVRRAWRATERVRTEGSAAVVTAALRAGVPRLVQESVAMLYRDQGAAWVDEDAPVDHYPATAGNHAAEASARRFAAAGGVAVVLRLGLFYGPGAKHSEEMLTLARRHVGLVMGPAGSYLSSIHVADGGSAVVHALAAPSGTFNIVDDEPLTKRGYADALAAAAGVPPWVRLPGRAGLLFGDRLTSMTRSLRVRNTRFREATGWTPCHPSAREGWAATAAALTGTRA
jgi:nucleoside-diphosphate-sugar epimerase